jgi:hypothetical protein
MNRAGRLLVALLGTVSLVAQEPAELVGPPSKLDTLRSLVVTRDKLRAEAEAQRKRERAETTETAKAEARAEAERLERRRQEVERDFATLSTGLHADDQGGKPAAEEAVPSLQQEIGQLLTPILTDLRELTRKPRQFQQLREEIERLQEQVQQADRALAEIDVLIAQAPPAKGSAGTLNTALSEVRKQWQGRRDEATTRMTTAAHQLQQLNGADGSFWSGVGQQFQEFVFTRGTNILLAALAFLFVLYGLRALYYGVLRLLPVRRYARLNFTIRILDIAHQGISLLLATATGLLVLYARGDWMLGGLALLSIGALLITAKSGLARHMEQLRLLLNLGPVREGERVMIGGVPWRVGKIHLFTQLTNSIIGGPGLRLPIEQLAGMTSRPIALDEAWFPCRKRDWILLNGSTHAQVSDITPEHVELNFSGGQRRWIPVADFLKADVAVLSGGFSRSTTFGIDYAHLQQATSEIPALLREELRAALLEKVPETDLLDVIVEFQEAAASSLNYLLLARFAGSQAPNYPGLGRLLQRAAVESCRRHGWSIPFPHLVVEQSS